MYYNLGMKYDNLFEKFNSDFQIFSVESRGSTIYTTVRNTKNPEELICKKITDYRPYFYVPKEEIKTYTPFINIDECNKIEVKKPSEVKNARERYPNTYEADILYDIRFLIDMQSTYKSNSNVNPRVCFFDIEVYREHSFGSPESNNPIHIINCITLYDTYNSTYITIIVNNNSTRVIKKDKSIIINVTNEYELINTFCKIINKLKPDVLTGWNSNYFDAKYLIERTENFYPDLLKKLSYFDVPPVLNEIIFGNNTKEIRYNTYGFSFMDYMLLYKKYSNTPREKYTLDYVCKMEINKGKVEYNGSLDELYEKDIEKFIEYSIKDVELIVELDKKLQFINLVNELKELTACPMKYFNHDNTLKYVDSLTIKHIRNNNLCITSGNRDNVKNKYKGSYVKEPKPGFYGYCIEYDGSSLYPSTMLSLNASPDTYICRIIESEDLIKTKIRPYLNNSIENTDITDININTIDGNDKIIDIKKLKNALIKSTDGSFSISISGAIFRTNKTGIFIDMQKFLINKRSEYKKQLKQTQQSTYNIKQLAYKLVGNSVYGYFGNLYSRLYSRDIAETISLQGREVNKTMMDYIENELKIPVIYGDTDSVFLDMDNIIPDDIKTQGVELVVDYINEYMNIHVASNLNDRLNQIAKELNINEHAFHFKQEVIADSALFLIAKDVKKLSAKKRYILHIVDENGIRKDEIFARGIELRRSELPNSIKTFMGIWIENLITKKKSHDELTKELIYLKSDIKTWVDKKELDNICIYRALSKSIDQYEKTLPEIRGVKLWNVIAKEFKLPVVTTGAKLRIIYVNSILNIEDTKYNNILTYLKNNSIDTIAIPTDIPEEHIHNDIWKFLKVNMDETYRKLLYDSTETYLRMINKSMDELKYGQMGLI